MATVAPPREKSQWEGVFDAAGKAVGNAYEAHVDRKHQRADDMAIQGALSSLPPGSSAEDMVRAITGVKLYNKDRGKELMTQFVGAQNVDLARSEHTQRQKVDQEKLDIDRAKTSLEANRENNKLIKEQEDKVTNQKTVDSLVDSLPLADDIKKNLKESGNLKVAEELVKENFKTKEEKLTPFEKKVQEKQAEEYINAVKENAVVDDVLAGIEDVEGLIKDKFSGLLGNINPLTGYLPTEANAELEAKSFPLIQPIVKMFNPTGPVAVQKLKIIEQKYKILPTDLPSKMRGKLKALKAFATRGKAQHMKKIALYEKYDGRPPKQALDALQNENDAISDQMVDMPVEGETSKEAGIILPKQLEGKAEKYTDKTIKGPDGQKYKSNGKEWTLVK